MHTSPSCLGTSNRGAADEMSLAHSTSQALSGPQARLATTIIGKLVNPRLTSPGGRHPTAQWRKCVRKDVADAKPLCGFAPQNVGSTVPSLQSRPRRTILRAHLPVRYRVVPPPERQLGGAAHPQIWQPRLALAEANQASESNLPCRHVGTGVPRRRSL